MHLVRIYDYFSLNHHEKSKVTEVVIAVSRCSDVSKTLRENSNKVFDRSEISGRKFVRMGRKKLKKKKKPHIEADDSSA